MKQALSNVYPSYVKEGDLFIKKYNQSDDFYLIGFKEKCPVLTKDEVDISDRKVGASTDKLPVKKFILRTDRASGKKFLLVRGKVIEVTEVIKCPIKATNVKVDPVADIIPAPIERMFNGHFEGSAPKINTGLSDYDKKMSSTTEVPVNNSVKTGLNTPPNKTKSVNTKVILSDLINKLKTDIKYTAKADLNIDEIEENEEELLENFVEFLKEKKHNKVSKSNQIKYKDAADEINVNISIKRNHYVENRKPDVVDNLSMSDGDYIFDYEDFDPLLQEADLGAGPNPKAFFNTYTNPENIMYETNVKTYDCLVPQQDPEVPVNQAQNQLVQRIYQDFQNCVHFDNSGNMPIHVAVIEGNIATVERQCMLLKWRRQDINTTNYMSYTPIQLAVLLNAKPEIVSILLRTEFQADLSVVDNEGNSLLHLCVMKSNAQNLRRILEAIHQQAEVTIDSFNYEGLTPLMLSVKRGLKSDIQMAEVLLSKGADPNINDQKSGRTALFHAVESDNYEMALLLMHYKADPKVRNFFGTSPHDAVYEIDNISPGICHLILGKFLPAEKEKKRKRKKIKKPVEEFTVKPDGEIDDEGPSTSSGLVPKINNVEMPSTSSKLMVKKPRFTMLMIKKFQKVDNMKKE